MTDFGRVGLFGEAAVEIERLRARVEVLEQHLRYAISVADMAMIAGNPDVCDRLIDRARAALEAKP
jgi:hypothetical protein